MNQGRKRIGVVFFSATSQIVFWILYTQTGNISVSISITAVICIVLSGVLFRLSQVDKRKQN
jgi:1,4-dihydroxy-2-naphthoate octaprenyltransferase